MALGGWKPDAGARPVFRLAIKAGIAMGPGKAALLKSIEQNGSITAAAKALGMSYRRAWMLVDSMNEHFRAPLVDTRRGGAARGGAIVTELGRQVLSLYERMQQDAERAVAIHAIEFERLLK